MRTASSDFVPVPSYTRCLSREGVMSSINDALRKAQQEKDIQGVRYGSILARSTEKEKTSGRRVVWRACFTILVILLAFAGFSWLDSGLKQEPLRRDTSTPRAVSYPRQGSSRVDTSSLYERAREHYKSGEIREAKRLYMELLKLDPGHVEALNNLGVIYIQTGDFSSAQKVLEKAIRLRPSFVDPFYNMACLYAARGELDKSLSYVERAVSLNPAAREWARIDRDLEGLRGLNAFKKIMKTTQSDQG